MQNESKLLISVGGEGGIYLPKVNFVIVLSNLCEPIYHIKVYYMIGVTLLTVGLYSLCVVQFYVSSFDSYHLSPFPNDCRQAVLVAFVVDATGMQLDVLCLCMTWLHRFSLCFGFVGAVIHHRREFIRRLHPAWKAISLGTISPL